jgi:hypothetical protein
MDISLRKIVMLGWGRRSGRTRPAWCDNQEKRGVCSCSQTGTAPILFAGQRLGVRAVTRSAWDAYGAWGPCMHGVTRGCMVTRERMTSRGSSWQEHWPAFVCAVCCFRDGWPWASSSVLVYVFQVHVLYVSFGCCTCFIRMFAYVAMTIHVCCTCVFKYFSYFI